eukprot:1562232-Pyramimonas_sp.AAC.1
MTALLVVVVVCPDTRQCGFSKNYGTNERCYMCGRDRMGRPNPTGAQPPGMRARSSSAARKSGPEQGAASSAAGPEADE